MPTRADARPPRRARRPRGAPTIGGLRRRAHILWLVCAAALLLAAAPAGTADLSLADRVTERPCFGAASRDPRTRCIDPELRTTIFPAPAVAVLEPNAPCRPTGRTGLLYPCTFGPPGTTAAGPVAPTIALVGDSHASQWRAAVDVVAHEEGQAAVSIARSRCPFLDAVVVLEPADRRACRAWNAQLRTYLARHPEIHTLFISNRASARVVAKRGRSGFETQVAGHIALWRSLPSTVQRIAVIRDTPRSSAASALCVQRAFAERHAAGRRCARPRAAALHPDPGIVAARRMRSPRVRAIDLSELFCDPRRCFPVIGGAAVYKDVDHVGVVFTRTLGPFLLRAYRAAFAAAPVRGPFDGLRPDERAAAECLIAERLIAARAGGWEQAGLDHLERANACRATLEQRVRELEARGLTAERDRKRRHALILAVLDTRTR